MSKRINLLVQEAVAAGLLEPATSTSKSDEHPWPVLVFTALAAWLSAIPLMLLVFVVGSSSSVFGMTWGVPILGASTLLLRSRKMPLFVTQLAVPCLLAGLGLIGFGTAETLHSYPAGANVALLFACVVAVPVRQAWVRTLLGAAIGGLGATSLALGMSYWPGQMHFQLSWLSIAFVWLLLHMFQRAIVLKGATARLVAGLEAISAGMGAVSLSGIIWASGRTFLLGEALDAPAGSIEVFRSIGMMRGISATLAIVGGSWLAYRWPILRAWWYALVLGLCGLLAWFSPLLGVCLALLCVCVESRHYMLAAYAALAAGWMIGGLYYATAWPLALKAQLLASAGLGLALLGRYAIVAPLAEPELTPETAPQRIDKRKRVGFLVSGLIVLGVANAAIWQKENLIRTGAPVYVELAYVDPRSLMQGDYIALYFDLPERTADGRILSKQAGQVVARMDERHVAKLLRLHDGSALNSGEFVIDVVRRHNNLTLVANAWHFKEGEARRWRNARYGEFRVRPSGEALLVGLRGPNLEKL